MPSTPYDLVQDDQDLRVPLHADQAFLNGITFQAKFVGWEEVPRPNTRAEIVQAMRRIRYECKVQNLKKRKVIIHISVNGVRVVLKKRRRKKKNWSNDCEEIELLNHPVYRIFYVSHDSSDLKIFSYIARDASTDTFKCSVFKSHKKSQAMRIVRTVGQAFEVCHKFNIHNKNSVDNNDEHSDISSSELLDVETRSDQQLSEDDGHNKKAHNISELNSTQRPNHLELFSQTSINKSGTFMIDEDKSPAASSSPSREINKLKDQLEQQSMQTRQALSQLMVVREQLISETNARIEAQARTQQLLQQNRELLEHLASLGAYNEQHAQGLTSTNIGIAPQNHLQLLLQATAGSANNNLATINQQINNLGSINQQLTSLSHQLSGLNQQTQNLQNLQQQQQQRLQHTPTSSAGGVQGNSLTPQIATTPLNQSQLHLNVSGPNAASVANTLSTSPFTSMNHLQNITTQLQQLHTAPVLQQQQTQQQQTQDALSKDLFSVNQELLNRLQALNLGVTSTMSNGGCGTPQPTPSPRNSFFFVNPMSCSSSNNNNAGSSNYNLLSTPSSMGNLTPSPMGTLNRNSYSNSPITDELCMTMDQNLNALDEQLMKTISNNNVTAAAGSKENSRSSSTVESPLTTVERSTSHLSNNTDLSPSMSSSPRFNTVMLKVTDEAGNVTNQRKLSATPSFITRSTSEKVPNRSQIMSQVQRTAWARHTTK